MLIYGASGGVGTYAVQLAKHFGARVAGVCGAANLKLVKSLGADEEVDYTKQDFSNAGRVYDVVFDAVGKCDVSRALKSLKRGGVFASAGLLFPPPSMLLASLTGAATFVVGVAKGSAEDLSFLMGLVAAGKMKVAIDRRYLLNEIAEAHR